MDPDRVKNNAHSVVSRWKNTRPNSHILYQNTLQIQGRYDDASLDPFNVRILPSPIHGLGVFTKRDIAPNHEIVLLPCKYVTHAESVQYKNYTFDLSFNPVYSQIAVTCWNVAHANFSRFINSSAPAEGNVEIQWHGPVGVIVASEYIPRNTELLLNYSL